MHLNRALRIGLIYLVVSVLWIVFSDRVVFGLPVSADVQRAVQTFKGLGFVAVSAVLVSLLAWRELLRSAELARSDERYAKLFAASPLPTWVFDRETLRFLEVNQAAVDRYGWSRDEFLAMDLADIRPPGDVPELERAVEDTPMEGFHDAGTFRHCTRDGTVIVVQITSHRVEFEGHDAELVVAEDVTGRLEIEAQLRQAQRMESVGRLAGGVAHDFNNLLTVIGNLAALAREELEPGSTHQETYRQIEAAQQRGAALTRQLLTFSRDAPGRRGRADAAGALREMTAMLRPLLGERIEIDVELPSCECVVPLAPIQLEQVIMNLAVNARDAMPDGGRLTMRLACGPTTDGDTRIVVADTGTGMSDDVRSRIFEPFFTTKGFGQGTGLGLSTTYGLVTAAGGDIAVASTPGEGTTFTVTLPTVTSSTEAERAGETDAVEEAPVSDDVYPPTPLDEATGCEPEEARANTILVVEDEPALRSLVERGLRRRGFRVITADDGTAALDLLANLEERVDLVITDMVMPGMTGTEFLDHLGRVRPGAKTILVSGYAAADIDGDLPGDRQFLAKPFTLAELGRAVEAALGQ